MILKNRVIGGVLLVAGTTIGGAVLALPVSTGTVGFAPSFLLFLGCWLYLTYTAFLFLEVNLWFEGDTNIISMAQETLGAPGKAVGWLAYLLLLYALTTAYVAASGAMCHDLASAAGIPLPDWAGPFPLLLTFGWFLYWGTSSVDMINRMLMIGLGIAFLMLLFLVAPSVDTDQLARSQWSGFNSAASVIVTAFGFHIIIPSLTEYIGHDVKPMKKALFIGSAIPLMIYIVWEALILGIVPLLGEYGLAKAQAEGTPVTVLLRGLLEGDAWISLGARLFDFCAILTSFLGVSLSLIDFLADGLHVKKNHKGRAFLMLLTFVPPLILATVAQRAFFTAIEIAGGIGVAILLGLLPALMTWAGRYHHDFKGPFRVPGGKPALIAAMLISILVVANELMIKIIG